MIPFVMPNLDQVIGEITDLQYAGGRKNHILAWKRATEVIESGNGSVALYNMRGVSRRMIGDYNGAKGDFLAALTDDSVREKIRALVNLADIERVAYNHLDDALALLLMADIESEPKSLERVLVHNQRGLVYTAKMMKDPDCRDFAIQNYERAARICENSLDIEGDRETRKRYADALCGLAYLSQRDLEKVVLGKTALGHYEAVKDMRGQFSTLRNLGKAMYENADYGEASIVLDRAWTIAQEEDEPRAMASIALDLCEISFRQNDKSAGKKYYVRFIDSRKALTRHDYHLMMPQIKRVEKIYEKS
jgi:tetratricopeptide (TPR) repeat protein